MSDKVLKWVRFAGVSLAVAPCVYFGYRAGVAERRVAQLEAAQTALVTPADVFAQPKDVTEVGACVGVPTSVPGVYWVGYVSGTTVSNLDHTTVHVVLNRALREEPELGCPALGWWTTADRYEPAGPDGKHRASTDQVWCGVDVDSSHLVVLDHRPAVEGHVHGAWNARHALNTREDVRAYRGRVLREYRRAVMHPPFSEYAPGDVIKGSDGAVGKVVAVCRRAYPEISFMRNDEAGNPTFSDVPALKQFDYLCSTGPGWGDFAVIPTDAASTETDVVATVK